MTQVERLARRNVVLGVLAALLLVFVVLRPSPTSAVGEKAWPALFPKLKLDDVRTIEIAREPKPASSLVKGEPEKKDPEKKDQDGPKEVRIERVEGDAWTIPTNHDFPASPDRVRSFLEDVQKARLKKVVTERPDTFDDYAATTGWTRIQILDAKGETLADLELGKAAGWPDSFVRIKVDGKPRIVRAYNLSPDHSRVTLDAWVDDQLWPGLSVTDVNQVELFQTEEKNALSFARKTKPSEPAGAGDEKEGDEKKGDEKGAPKKNPSEDGWVMRAPKEQDAETYKVENLVRTVAGMHFEDVVDRGSDSATLAKYGLDTPAYRVVLHLAPKPGAKKPSDGEGETKSLVVGGRKMDSDGSKVKGWYVRRGDDDWIFEVADASMHDLRSMPDAFLPPPPPR